MIGLLEFLGRRQTRTPLPPALVQSVKLAFNGGAHQAPFSIIHPLSESGDSLNSDLYGKFTSVVNFFY
jgi:hypothetical protein